eukprot:766160-Hanusia_phi.AAC.1
MNDPNDPKLIFMHFRHVAGNDFRKLLWNWVAVSLAIPSNRVRVTSRLSSEDNEKSTWTVLILPSRERHTGDKRRTCDLAMELMRQVADPQSPFRRLCGNTSILDAKLIEEDDSIDEEFHKALILARHQTRLLMTSFNCLRFYAWKTNVKAWKEKLLEIFQMKSFCLRYAMCASLFTPQMVPQEMENKSYYEGFLRNLYDFVKISEAIVHIQSTDVSKGACSYLAHDVEVSSHHAGKYIQDKTTNSISDAKKVFTAMVHGDEANLKYLQTLARTRSTKNFFLQLLLPHHFCTAQTNRLHSFRCSNQNHGIILLAASPKP